MMMKKTLIEEIWDEQESFTENKPHRVITNFVDGEWIDRVYGGDKKRLLQGEFGKEYKGKLTEKKFRRYRTGIDGKAVGVYYQRYTHTADGRWFDNSGFPCEKPHHAPKQSDIEEDDEQWQKSDSEKQMENLYGILIISSVMKNEKDYIVIA